MAEIFNGTITDLKKLFDGYKSEIGEEKLTEVQFCSLQKAVNDGNIVFFIEKIKNEIVGMCSLSRTFSTYNCAFSGVFEDFYILPIFRKRGIAKKLTESVFGFCRKNGIDSLWVGCADCDAKMYSHLGFNIELGNLLAWSSD